MKTAETRWKLAPAMHSIEEPKMLDHTTSSTAEQQQDRSSDLLTCADLGREVIPLRSPVNELSPEALGWSLKVRPRPDGVPTLLLFENMAMAQRHAIDLRHTSGWPIIIHRPDMDGAA
jgi:hypothetical protein